MRKNNWTPTLQPHEIADWDQAVATAAATDTKDLMEHLTELVTAVTRAPAFEELMTTLMIVSEAHAQIPPGFELVHPSGRAKFKCVAYELTEDGKEISNETNEVYE